MSKSYIIDDCCGGKVEVELTGKFEHVKCGGLEGWFCPARLVNTKKRGTVVLYATAQNLLDNGEPNEYYAEYEWEILYFDYVPLSYRHSFEN